MFMTSPINVHTKYFSFPRNAAAIKKVCYLILAVHLPTFFCEYILLPFSSFSWNCLSVVKLSFSLFEVFVFDGSCTKILFLFTCKLLSIELIWVITIIEYRNEQKVDQSENIRIEWSTHYFVLFTFRLKIIIEWYDKFFG